MVLDIRSPHVYRPETFCTTTMPASSTIHPLRSSSKAMGKSSHFVSYRSKTPLCGPAGQNSHGVRYAQLVALVLFLTAQHSFIPALVGAALCMAVAANTIQRQEQQQQAQANAPAEALGQAESQNLRLLDVYGGRTSLHDVEHAVDIYEVQ